MRRIIPALLLSIPFLTLFGCASGIKMPLSSNQQLQAPPAGKAQIVFMRPSSFGFAISASLFDVTKGEPAFLGIIQSKNKIVHTVAPGEHTFMVVSESADFMLANVSANKTYYVLVTPRMGAWKARFSLQPVRKSGGDFNMESKDFDEWVNVTKIVEINDVALNWAQANIADVKKKQSAYWPKWQTKPKAEIEAMTLNANDGI